MWGGGGGGSGALQMHKDIAKPVVTGDHITTMLACQSMHGGPEGPENGMGSRDSLGVEKSQPLYGCLKFRGLKM